MIRAELGDGGSLGPGVQVTYSPEPEILGTGGGIKQMAELTGGGTSLVLNAKYVMDLDVAALLALHRARGAVATMVVRAHPEAERWGAIRVDPGGRVTGILDRLAPGSAPGHPYQFTGVHVVEPELVERLPDGVSCVIRSAYFELLEAGAPIVAVVHDGYFYDHSTLPRYLQGNLNLLRGATALPHAPGPLRGRDPAAEVAATARVTEPVLIGPGALIEVGASVGPGVVLGPGSRVAGGVELADAVVWPGAAVTASGRRLVVGREGAVAIPDVADPEARPR
jgi:mannose-1-phosphate guanylyltransferase